MSNAIKLRIDGNIDYKNIKYSNSAFIIKIYNYLFLFLLSPLLLFNSYFSCLQLHVRGHRIMPNRTFSRRHYKLLPFQNFVCMNCFYLIHYNTKIFLVRRGKILIVLRLCAISWALSRTAFVEKERERSSLTSLY